MSTHSVSVNIIFESYQGKEFRSTNTIKSYTVRYAKKLLNQIVYLFFKDSCMAFKTGI